MEMLQRRGAQQLGLGHNAGALAARPADPRGAEEETGMSLMTTSLNCELQFVIRFGLHRQAYLQNSLMFVHWGTQGAALHQESVANIVLSSTAKAWNETT